MPSLRTKSISTKVTDEEYAQFEALAGEQTISEWARDVLLKATKPNPGEQTVLAEVLALRTILLNIHFAVSQGQTLTAEQMQELRSEEHTSELQSRQYLVCRLLLEKKKQVDSIDICLIVISPMSTSISVSGLCRL